MALRRIKYLTCNKVPEHYKGLIATKVLMRDLLTVDELFVSSMAIIIYQTTLTQQLLYSAYVMILVGKISNCLISIYSLCSL